MRRRGGDQGLEDRATKGQCEAVPKERGEKGEVEEEARLKEINESDRGGERDGAVGIRSLQRRNEEEKKTTEW